LVNAGVFIEKRQSFERAHPIEKQDAIQMIRLVKNDACGKIVRAQLNALAVPVERADCYLTLAAARLATSGC
jgi:hypothetical protein